MNPFVGGNRTTKKLIKVFKKLPRFSNKGHYFWGWHLFSRRQRLHCVRRECTKWDVQHSSLCEPWCFLLVPKYRGGASLVVQWLRIRLPMQGTRVPALVCEDPTCRGATGPVSHNYWACASGACAPQQEATTVRGPRTAMKSGPHLPQLEKTLT